LIGESEIMVSDIILGAPSQNGNQISIYFTTDDISIAKQFNMANVM
jgi:uncharacterized glyoxalase superfamily protein PhnB